MKRVFAVYTTGAIVDSIKALFESIVPDCRLVNIVDDGLIQDVIEAGGVTSRLAARLMRYFEAAAAGGADVIFNTCSSVGDVASRARAFFDVPILKIDEPMAVEAVRRAESIGVLATLSTTLDPTMRMIRSQAEQAGRSVSVHEGLADGAFQALVAGDRSEHDRIIEEAAAKLADTVELIVLAQGSMARMEGTLRERTGRIVLSSPESGVRAVRERLA